MVVTIRMNVDRDNMNEAEVLFEELERVSILKKINNVDLAHVVDFSGKKHADSMLSNREFADFWMRMAQLAVQRGWPIARSPPTPKLSGICQVDTEDGMVLEPSGELVRCYAELGNSDKIVVGNVLRQETWNSTINPAFVERDPFDDEECLSCALLPSCMGGCPKLRHANRMGPGKQCPPSKYILPQLLLQLFGD